MCECHSLCEQRKMYVKHWERSDYLKFFAHFQCATHSRQWIYNNTSKQCIRLLDCLRWWNENLTKEALVIPNALLWRKRKQKRPNDDVIATSVQCTQIKLLRFLWITHRVFWIPYRVKWKSAQTQAARQFTFQIQMWLLVSMCAVANWIRFHATHK